MTPVGYSSSAGESSMDNNSNTTFITTTTTTTHKHKHKLKQTTTTTLNNKRKNSNSEEEEQEQEQEGGPEVWQSFNTSFRQVQSVLDRNRVLIQQVNENHQSKIPDNMVKNVALIQEINGNISKVVSLYSDLSTNFTSAFHQRNKDDDDDDDDDGDDGDGSQREGA